MVDQPKKLVDPSSFVEECEIWRRSYTNDFVPAEKYEQVGVLNAKVETVNVNDRIKPTYITDVEAIRIVSWFDQLEQVKPTDKLKIRDIMYRVYGRPIRFTEENALFGVLFLIEDVTNESSL